MRLYKCKVLTNSGSMRILKMEGLSKNAIVENLKRSSFTIVDVKDSRHDLEKINLLSKARKVKSKELSLICRQMNIMLKSGITIVKCFEILNVQTGNKNFRKIIAEMHRELLTGSTLSEAVCNHRELFPPMFVTMVQAGELSGNIDSIMGRLAGYYGKENKIENKIKAAMTYPAILSIVSVAVVIFMLVEVMPTFVDLYSSYGASLPLMTVVLLNISQWIKNMWHSILLFIAVLVISIKRLNKNYNTRYTLDSLKIRTPFYGLLKAKLAASRFTRTLSILLNSGVSMIDGLEIVAVIVGNEYISRLILNAREDVKRGFSLAFSIKKQNMFPPIVYSMIKLGEESGEIEDVLDKTADFCDEEAEIAIQRLISAAEPLMIVLMAAIIGFIMLAITIPMFDMAGIVQ